MPTTIDETDVTTTLRNRAEALLQSGTTPSAGHWSMGVDALSLLHRLSSDPDRAQDALKVLHELQVHQVELDVQNEEISASERALEEELQAYRALYESAPLGYCVVDLEGTVIRGNIAAAELFGVGRDELEGQRVGTFLNPQSRPCLLDLLQRVAQSGARDRCVAETGDVQNSRPLQCLASVSPGGEHILLGLCENANVA